MPDTRDLQQRFAIPGVVTIEPGAGNLPRLNITAPSGEAHIYLHGAHVTHYQPRGQKPVLFLSGESLFQPGKAIRGGIPVIFPWFGGKAGEPTAPAHGFARNIAWELRDVKQSPDGSVTVELALPVTDAMRAQARGDFTLRYSVTVGSTLSLSLEVRNTSSAPFTFEEALHTYLVVGDVRSVRIDGFSGREFIDKVDGAKRKVQPAGPVTITGETDRVYLNARDTIRVEDPTLGRTLVVEKEGSLSTVLWNPWIDKAKAMADFGDDEWPAMLCVETANAADNAVTLAAGETHLMRTLIRSNIDR